MPSPSTFSLVLAHHCYRFRPEPPCFFPGVSSPFLACRTSSRPLISRLISSRTLCPPPCTCHAPQLACDFSAVCLFGVVWSPPRIILFLFVAQSPCSLPFLVALLTLRPRPWNHKASYRWVFKVVIRHGGFSQSHPRCLNHYH